MARSDGKFPSYTKLRIDPKKWPEHYWDSSLSCTSCDKRWPNTHLFKTCVDCGGKTTQVEDAPNVRWPEAVSAILHARFESLYEIWNEDVPDEKLEWEDVKTNGELDKAKVTSAVEELIETTRPIQKQT